MNTIVKSRIVPLWVVIYDDSPDQTYTFTSMDKVILSIDGSIRQMVDDEDVCTSVINAVKERANDQFIPIVFKNLSISIVKLELDRHNEIHKLLYDCMAYIDDQERQNSIPWNKRAELLRRLNSVFS